MMYLLALTWFMSVRPLPENPEQGPLALPESSAFILLAAGCSPEACRHAWVAMDQESEAATAAATRKTLSSVSHAVRTASLKVREDPFNHTARAELLSLQRSYGESRQVLDQAREGVRGAMLASIGSSACIERIERMTTATRFGLEPSLAAVSLSPVEMQELAEAKKAAERIEQGKRSQGSAALDTLRVIETDPSVVAARSAVTLWSDQLGEEFIARMGTSMED